LLAASNLFCAPGWGIKILDAEKKSFGLIECPDLWKGGSFALERASLSLLFSLLRGIILVAGLKSDMAVFFARGGKQLKGMKRERASK
jgi:hypothetical protein